MFDIGHPWNNLQMHWLLMNCLCFKGDLSFYLCVQTH
jgi:hypothetical protein